MNSCLSPSTRILPLPGTPKELDSSYPYNVVHDLDTTVRELTSERPTLDELESSYIARLLDEFGGHRARVAEVLGISERNLYRKLKSLRP